MPPACCIYPIGNVGYDYYIGVWFGDMANAFFAITFAEDGGQLPSSFILVHLIFACKACLIVWRLNMQGLLLW
jgi:hypothetical protein